MAALPRAWEACPARRARHGGTVARVVAEAYEVTRDGRCPYFGGHHMKAPFCRTEFVCYLESRCACSGVRRLRGRDICLGMRVRKLDLDCLFAFSRPAHPARPSPSPILAPYRSRTRFVGPGRKASANGASLDPRYPATTVNVNAARTGNANAASYGGTPAVVHVLHGDPSGHHHAETHRSGVGDTERGRGRCPEGVGVSCNVENLGGYR